MLSELPESGVLGIEQRSLDHLLTTSPPSDLLLETAVTAIDVQDEGVEVSTDAEITYRARNFLAR